MCIKKITPSLTIVFLLAACGGGGGGGGGGLASGVASSPINFTRFDYTDFTAASKGIYTSVNYSSNGTVTSVGQIQSHTSGRVSVDYNALGDVTGLSVNSPQFRETFRITDNTPIVEVPFVDAVVVADDADTARRNEYIALFDYNNDLDEQYGSFGYWEDDNGSTGALGIEVFGDFSNANQIPTTGTATYFGYHGGGYTDGQDNTIVTTGSFRSDVDFATRTFAAGFTNTIGFNADTGSYQNLSQLDFAYTALIVPDDYDLSRGITSNMDYRNFRPFVENGADNGLSGQATHFFMGPNAEEMSGYFYFTNDSSNNFELYSGGFTGKQ